MDKIKLIETRRLGIIAFKFGLTAIAALYTAERIFPQIDTLSCAFIALISLQPNLYRGVKSSLSQIKGTTLAAAVTILTVFIFRKYLDGGISYAQAGINSALIMILCVKFKLSPTGIITALFTGIYLSIIPSAAEGEFWRVIYLRYFTILTAIIIALIFNFLSSLLRHKDRLYLNLVKISFYIKDVFSKINGCLTVETANKDELENILNNYRKIFSAISNIETDISEIEKNIFAFKRRAEQTDDTVFIDNLISNINHTLNNISHYSWNIVLNLMNFDIAPRVLSIVKTEFESVKKYFFLSADAFKSLNLDYIPEKESECLITKEGILNHLNEDNAKTSGRLSHNSAAELSLLTDIAHLKLNLTQYSGLVRLYIKKIKG